MKIPAILVLAMLVTGALTSCGSGSPAATTATSTQAAAVTGLSTPKSVSVVTAN